MGDANSNSMNNLRTPPILAGEESYLEWKEDLAVWELFTDLEKKKRGPAVYLSLTGCYRDKVRDLTVEEIGSNEGVKKITDKLDEVYLKDKDTQCFMAFESFYNYRRASGVNITEFLVDFGYLCNKLSKQNIELPDGVMAFMLLKASNISVEHERLARATCEKMTYEKMKSCILKIYGETGSDGGEGSAPSIKSEPVFQTNHEDALQSSWRGGWRSRGRGGRNRRGAYGQGSGYRTRSPVTEGTERVNPVGKDGYIMKCYKCGSTKHFARYCKKSTNDKPNEIHIVLMNSAPELSSLVLESLGMGLLDSACTRTVAGKAWFDAYCEALSESERALIETTKVNTTFRFGDGKDVVSLLEVKFPVVIGVKKITIRANIVDSEIPLLLSKASMKKAKLILNFNDDSAQILGQKVKLYCTSSGHYCIPLSNTMLYDGCDMSSFVLHAEGLASLTENEKYKKAVKLHKQFAHASKERLCRLVNESPTFKDAVFLKMIEKCCDSCEFCLKRKPPPLRPVVGLPLANVFNDVVCMDLKEHIHNKSWILHIIDSATKYSAACLISSKHQDVIIACIFRIWFTYFGFPRKFLTDNGGEFSNERFREMNEKFNIETATTAAESPFSNGIVERHNLVLAEAMDKTIEDAKCSPDVALAWAVSAKNALQNHGGFSPNQLVFGRNVNSPSVLTDLLPALTQSTSSDIMRENINAIHSSMKNYMAAESSEKIRKALRHKVRTYADVSYEKGDKVYYRRKNYKGWKGPAVVLGQDGQYVLVRHGGAFYRVHPCHLLKLGVDISNGHGSVVSDGQSSPVHKSTKGVKSSPIRQFVDDSDSSVVVNGDVIANMESVVSDVSENYDRDVPSTDSDETCHDGSVKPSRNTYVRYKLNIEDDWSKAKVLSIQPKQTGQYRDWLNVHVDGQDEPMCVNWDHVSAWSELPFPEQVLVLSKDQEVSQEVVDAKNKELQKMISNDVFEIVPFSNQDTVSSLWLLTEKYRKGVKVTKARLVARGFEEDSSAMVKDSPTCDRESLRMVFVVGSIMIWEIQSIDISAAFLQGRKLEREIYLRPPSDVCPRTEVWRLKRCIYGLNDAPRSWYERVKEVLLQLGGTVSAYDSALFLWFDSDGTISGILVSHVDDFAFCGNQQFHEKVIGGLKNIFKVNTHDYGSFKYVGLEVCQNSEGIQVNQDAYIDTIMPIDISPSRRKEKLNVLSQEERKDLRRLSGQMLWVSSQTRPDCSFETCMMSNTGKQPRVAMMLQANKALSKLKKDRVQLKFPSLGDYRKLSVSVFSDATYASMDDGSSQGGHIVFLRGVNNKVVPISWQSKRLYRVTKSPLASETLALCEGADAGFLVSSLVREIFNLPSLPPVQCYTDNRSLTDTLVTTRVISDRRLRVDVARLREMVAEKEICVNWVNGKSQVADALTKRGASSVSLIEVLNSSCI